MKDEKTLEEQISKLSERIDQNSNDKEAYLGRGNIYGYLEKSEEALQDFSRAIEIDPNYKEAYYKRGNLYIILGKYEKALQEYSGVIKIDPNCKKVYYNRGMLYSILGKYKEALQDYNKVIKLDPNNKEVYYNRWHLYGAQRKYKEALKNYNKIIEIDPDDKEKILFYVGFIYLLKKDIINAGKKFIEARKDMFDIITLSDNTDLIRQVIEYMISNPDENDFFKKITNSINQRTLDIYKSIYTNILLIISLLYVRINKEKPIAHYTTKNAAQQMLFDISPFRLTTTLTVNDPQEGQTIFQLLEIDKIKSVKNDNRAFIGCFSFNYENLNQFRLYGKKAGKEATGISLTLNEKFFSNNISSNYIIPINKNIGEKQKKEQELLPLFRCVYVDPNTRKVISLGHKEDYLFYRESKDYKDISKYIRDLNKKKKKIAVYLEEIRKIIKENNNLDYSVISKLFLP